MRVKEILLEIRNLRVQFKTFWGMVKALDGVNLDIYKGEVLGLVGETGCGKSVTALSIMRLIPSPPGQVVEGKIIFKGEGLLKKSEDEMRKIRGSKISMIFQEPLSSLNPVFKVGDQITRVIKLHQREQLCKGAIGGFGHKIPFLSWLPMFKRYERRIEEEAKKRAIHMFRTIGLPNPEGILERYPHELSGGMAQRVMISIMLSCRPDLLIADEATSFLDVTIQAQILKLLRDLKDEINFSILLITHNLGAIAQICDRVAVMYAGNIVECGDINSIFNRAKHPYTQGLLEAAKMGERGRRIATIRGFLPDLINPPPGCRFHPRCPKAKGICGKKKPQPVEVKRDHSVSCWLYNRKSSSEG